MVLRYLGYTFFIFFLSKALFSTESIDLSLLPTADETFALVDDLIKEPFVLEKLSFSSDTLIGEKELRYLTGLKEGATVTREMLKRACWHLKRKNKFDTVTIHCTQGVQGKLMTLAVKSAWTFFKVTCKGSLVGKDRYQQYYLLESGEPFDLAKHQHSLVKIQRELKQNGYFHAKLTDHITYDKDTKRVSVTLSFENVERFTIQAVQVKVTIDDKNKNDVKRIEDKVRSLFEGLKNHYYERSLVESQLEEVKTFLVRKGYLHPKITISRTIDDASRIILLQCSITLYQKKRFVFFGNHFYSSEQLLNEVLLIGNSAVLIPPALLADDIKALYKKKGFWRVRVEWREEPHRFYFVINEGPRMRVSSVHIKGKSTLPAQELAKKSFNEFLKLPYFDADILQDALDTFGTYYLKEGFWDFKVTKQDFVAINDTTYELILSIEPGEKRILTGIAIKGFPQVLNSPFAQWIQPQKPQPFDVHTVQQQRQALLNYFKERGALYVTVKPELVPYREGLRLVWHVANVQEVRFGKTVIAGTSKIKSDIILRELQYKEGEPWSKEKVEQTIKRLKALNMFESVSLAPYNVATPEGTKTMVLKVVEDDPFEIRTRLGFQQMSKSFTHLSGTTYRVGGSFLWKNPCGIADQFRFDADITRYTRNIAFSYEIPWTLFCPVRSLYQVYSDRYEQPIGGKSKERLYKESHDGLSVSFNHAYWQGQVNVTAGFEFSKLSGLSEKLAKVIQFEPRLIDKREPYVYLESSFLWDNFDNKLDPTKGTLTNISLRGMFPLHIKNGFFIKALFEQSFVYPLYKSIIGALRFRVGHIFNAQFSTIMPTERFYLGGATSLRGYETDMVPPLNSFMSERHELNWVPVGGKSMVNINTEIRFPLYKWLSGVIFTDMGVLGQEKWTDIQAHKWLGATGIGLRCATPIGPVRFDIGWKWKKRDPQDKSYAWFITLGHAF